LVLLFSVAICNAQYGSGQGSYGTIGKSTSGGVTTNISNPFGDTNALAFAQQNGIQDIGVRNSLSVGVSEIKRLGVWTNLVDVLLLHPWFYPTNHLSFLGQPFSVNNEVYTPWGFGRTHYTNQIAFTLPATLTNFTLVFNYRSYALDMDTGNGTALNIPNNQIDLMGTNDGSTATWSGFTYNGLLARASQGTNFGFTITNMQHNAFVQVYPMMSGKFDSQSDQKAITKTVIALSMRGGRMQIYWDGKPAEFANSYNGGTGTATNEFSFPTPTGFNILHIGGGNTNWNVQLDSTSTFKGTNGYDTEFGSVQIYNEAIANQPSINQASYAFAECAENLHKAVSIQGSSIMRVQTQYGIYSLQYLIENGYPDTLVKSEAMEGSALSAYTSCGGGWTNNIAFQPVALTWLPASQFTDKSVFTDCPRNDIGTALATESAYFYNFHTNYTANGIKVYLVKTHYGQGIGSGGGFYSSGLYNIFDCVVTNFPLAGVIDESAIVTLEYLNSISADSPPTHINKNNQFAGEAQQSFASLLMGRGWTQRYGGYTNNTVSGSPYYWTNNFAYPVTHILTGGVLTGIAIVPPPNQGGFTNLFSIITTTGVPVKVAPLGGVMIITNSVVPADVIDTTQ
jgi:hypothetical protein